MINLRKPTSDLLVIFCSALKIAVDDLQAGADLEGWMYSRPTIVNTINYGIYNTRL
jgi:hypothetical protein